MSHMHITSSPVFPPTGSQTSPRPSPSADRVGESDRLKSRDPSSPVEAKPNDENEPAGIYEPAQPRSQIRTTPMAPTAEPPAPRGRSGVSIR